ncbi:MAG: hypothetical protein CMN56_15230 [Sneathiella sp.]|uniref:OmpH family outer membrane protein n=1 Tax=Sneathiella sp. TaxID=1964365 RepID=UPI000C636F6B|nr:OmpH family outer membrane protein [Sneathiella sp.]MAZ04485.1 hypothetical protein [Sneathiella sp.]|tara:strand:+ start:342 stop:836 length:495 start_codon:yes stop_codon:yes gene_type:complete
MKIRYYSIYKYAIYFILLIFSYSAAAADTGLIDYDKLLNKNAAVSEYTSEVASLKIKVMNDYDTLDSLRDAIIDDTKNRDARDKLAAELADKEAEIVKNWLVGLQKINAKYDDEIVAFDQKIQTAIDAVTQAKNLKFIKEGTVVEEDDTNTIDITPDVLKELEK